MGVTEVNIYCDNRHNIYFPGQTVYGTVEIVADTLTKVRAINVRCKGEAHTEWVESKDDQTSDGKTESTNTMHTGHEEYFQISYCIASSKAGEDHMDIPPGSHTYNFTCALPPVLPSSFEGPFGYVRYTIRIILDVPRGVVEETKLPFTVVNAFDLNLNPSYKEPIHIQMEKTFCCFCCASAPLSVDVRSPVSGFVPGQKIPVRVEVENKSNVQVHFIKIFLRRVVTYRATSPTKVTKKTKDAVLTLQEGPVPAGSTRSWNLTMRIPSAPPSDLVNCNIIDLDYDFKVDCAVAGLHIGLSGKKYIAIGTVPLVGLEESDGSPGQNSLLPTSEENSPTRTALLPVSPGSGSSKDSPAYDTVASTPPSLQPHTFGWSTPPLEPFEPPYQQLYPTLGYPVYQKCPQGHNVRERGESKLVKVHGSEIFSPCYPTYPHIKPPPLPQ